MDSSSEGRAVRPAAAFDRALERRDAAGMVAAILDIDHAIVAWSTDTLQSDDVDRAHSMLRSLVVAAQGRHGSR